MGVRSIYEDLEEGKDYDQNTLKKIRLFLNNKCPGKWIKAESYQIIKEENNTKIIQTIP